MAWMPDSSPGDEWESRSLTSRDTLRRWTPVLAPPCGCWTSSTMAWGPGPDEILDVGTGTGTLAVAARIFAVFAGHAWRSILLMVCVFAREAHTDPRLICRLGVNSLKPSSIVILFIALRFTPGSYMLYDTRPKSVASVVAGSARPTGSRRRRFPERWWPAESASRPAPLSREGGRHRPAARGSGRQFRFRILGSGFQLERRRPPRPGPRVAARS